MKKLPPDPRVTERNLFRDVVDWMREAARAVNSTVDELAGFTVARTGTSGTQATIAPVNGGNGDASLALNKVGATQNANIAGYKSGVPRWLLILGNSVAESGGNAGSDFQLDRYSDAGAPIQNAITFRRSDGLCTIPGTISAGASINAAGAISAAGNVTAPTFMGNGAQAVGWSSAISGGGETYEMLAYSGTGSGSGGANYVRSYHVHGVWAGWHFFCQGAASFEMRGTGTGYSVGGWVATSDARVKVNLQPVDDVLSWLDEIRVVEFDRTDAKEIDGTPVHQLGFIAQDFEDHAPAVVLQDPPSEGKPEPIRSLNYDGTTALLWRAVQQLKAIVKRQAAEIESLKGAPNGN